MNSPYIHFESDPTLLSAPLRGFTIPPLSSEMLSDLSSFLNRKKWN